MYQIDRRNTPSPCVSKDEWSIKVKISATLLIVKTMNKLAQNDKNSFHYPSKTTINFAARFYSKVVFFPMSFSSKQSTFEKQRNFKIIFSFHPRNTYYEKVEIKIQKRESKLINWKIQDENISRLRERYLVDSSFYPRNTYYGKVKIKIQKRENKLSNCEKGNLNWKVYTSFKLNFLTRKFNCFIFSCNSKILYW